MQRMCFCSKDAKAPQNLVKIGVSRGSNHWKVVYHTDGSMKNENLRCRMAFESVNIRHYIHGSRDKDLRGVQGMAMILEEVDLVTVKGEQNVKA